MDFNLISAKRPAIVLAPMEGVTDAPMRALLTERGGFHFCVSEFLRIGQLVPPPQTFYDHIPELKAGCLTPSGTFVQIQLLGGNEELMARSALRACQLGAKAIDLNFGCPSKTVNRHDGGATLLRFPERIKNIVSAVRSAVPPQIPVSAKLRLGWDNMDDVYFNSEQAVRGGASWITIHARTKTQGYAPPAYWKYIGEVRRRIGIPVVANGEIWTLQNFLQCQEETGCEHFMLGRGAMSNPSLIFEISRQMGIPLKNPGGDEGKMIQDILYWMPLLTRFIEMTSNNEKYAKSTVPRIKQWLKFAHLKNPLPWFDEIKLTQNLEDLYSILSDRMEKR